MPAESTRRHFLSSSAALTASAALLNQAGGAEAAAMKVEYYELRRYRMKRGPMPARLDRYFQQALLPAAKRHGLGPVGVFNVLVGPDNPTAHVLLSHPTAESVMNFGDRLAQDEQYLKGASDVRDLPPADPAYVNLDISLFKAADFMPRAEIPSTDRPRIFELRTYRSHSRRASRKKLEMFSPIGGELGIFRRVGLAPVFFAQCLFGADQPNLTYMLTYPDLAGREKSWAAFLADPDWKKLSATPGYTDAEIVTSISSLLLRPAAFSEI